MTNLNQFSLFKLVFFFSSFWFLIFLVSNFLEFSRSWSRTVSARRRRMLPKGKLMRRDCSSSQSLLVFLTKLLRETKYWIFPLHQSKYVFPLPICRIEWTCWSRWNLFRFSCFCSLIRILRSQSLWFFCFSEKVFVVRNERSLRAVSK